MVAERSALSHSKQSQHCADLKKVGSIAECAAHAPNRNVVKSVNAVRMKGGKMCFCTAIRVTMIIAIA